MEDVRQSFNVKKKNKRSLNIGTWINNHKKTIMWICIIFVLVNILFNPVNTANVVVNWFNDFIGTIVNGI